MIAIAEPSHPGEVSIYPVIEDHIKEVPEMVATSSKPLVSEHVAATGAFDELPYYVRSNCFAYVKHVYPETPPTATILANLTDSGEIAVFYYPESGLYHYAVVESLEPFIISDTNYGSDTKKTRPETGLHLIGFYDLAR